MYSPHYFYFYLRYDADLSESKSLESIQRHLKKVEHIEEKGRVVYKNVHSFPWIDISLLNANSYSTWALSDTISQCNLIAIVGSKVTDSAVETMDARYTHYTMLLKQLADVLGWELIEEETEDGLQDYMLYRPERKS